MRSRLVLVHSPLVTAESWRPLASVLRKRGRDATVPSFRLAESCPYQPKAARAIAGQLPAGPPVVLVGHSGAGVLLPAIAAAARVPVTATVFVDALLPQPGTSWNDTVEAELRDRLHGMASGGRLPPWDEWFPDALPALLPDPDRRAAFTAELPRLPLAYFGEPTPEHPFDPARSGYLQLSDGYTAQAGQAAASGQRVVRYAGHHLSGYTEPAAVADLLCALADAVSGDVLS